MGLKVDGKANLLQALKYILPVDPNVVLLPIELASQLIRVDAWILERVGENGREWHLCYRVASTLQYPIQLSHGLPVLGHMLQHVVADDKIEMLSRISDGGDIDLLDVWALWEHVALDILLRPQASYEIPKMSFGGDM